MENYKIQVNNEAESKEVQELFGKLGYKIEVFVPAGFPRWVATTDSGEDYWYSTGFDFIAGLSGFKELNLPQLRDLVVLKRNDVKDANYRSKSVLDGFYFKSCDGVFYFMFEGEWVRSTTNTDEGLDPITKGLDLISGAEALRALADGKSVEANNSDFGYWIDARNLGVKDFFDDIHVFRLKPQTIKLEIELPKPFEPKKDETYWYLTTSNSKGYDWNQFQSVMGDEFYCQFGAWRTEAEVKQVVEQLRKIKGAV